MIINVYNKAQIKEVARFIIVGAIATIVHYGVYLFLMHFLSINIAYSLAYALSFVINFFLSANFTFKSKASFKKGFGFGISHLINYGLHILFLNLFLYLGLSNISAPIPVFAVVIPINFLLVRFVFKSKKFQ